jgi:hypothetical protein
VPFSSISRKMMSLSQIAVDPDIVWRPDNLCESHA